MKIIAESAFNHNGNLNYLLELANAAKKSRSDYFTVQVYNTDAFCAKGICSRLPDISKPYGGLLSGVGILQSRDRAWCAME